MKKIFLLILGLLLCTNSFAKTKFSEVKKALKEDGYGKAVPEKFHHLNSPKAINPVSVSDFSIIGDKSIRFESNDGECWKEPKWNDCTNDRERTELYYKKKPWKKERWYRFYIHLPKDYNSIAPAKMSLIQWKRHKPSKVLVMFQHDHSGLTFNRNGDTFKDTYIVLKPNKDLLGSWTEIIYSTNWHLDPEKGFMKVWIDGKLKVDFKGRSNNKKGQELSLRYGLYSSSMSRYKAVFETDTMPQRIVFFDGVKEEKSCEKLLDETKCQSLKSQTINEYDVFRYSKYDKKLRPNSILKMSLSQFNALYGQ
tara:strand:+ start:104 stop:1030 length:927 start_codon:yes stop_codon:yes gene_type:complete